MAIVASRRPILLSDLSERLRRRAIVRDEVATWSEKERAYVVDDRVFQSWLAWVRWTHPDSEDAQEIAGIVDRTNAYFEKAKTADGEG